jgi:preprotein translocase subunit SecA
MLKIFNKNHRVVKSYKKESTKIIKIIKELEIKTDKELLKIFNELKEQLIINEIITPIKEVKKNIRNELVAIICIMSKRLLGLKPYEVQIIGSLILIDDKLAEMKTGEGKTLVSSIAIVYKAIFSQIHVVTVNDYLASRDAKSLSPLYEFFENKVGIIYERQEPTEKNEVYKSNIIYGTGSEFVFDFLRDNTVYNKEQFNQKEHISVVIDEVDSVLIDDARNPVILSEQDNEDIFDFNKIDELVKSLTKDDYDHDEKDKIITLNDNGIEKAEKFFNIENLFDGVENAILFGYINQSLKANYTMRKDYDYIVDNGKIIIIDEITGRKKPDSRYSDGLHQSLEAKENVEIQPESKTIIDTTYQNYFKLYKHISGMSGTLTNEAGEFWGIYKLEVVSVPTNKPIKRKDDVDLVFMSKKAKFKHLIELIKEFHKDEKPILIGTASIEQSEIVSELLQKENLEHEVLNAKNHFKESEIIEKAGLKGRITIATNMAGRGVDIKISKEVNELGGLHIIGTERYENRRIDDQLRGRAGRQGDNGYSLFLLSLEDDLLKILGGDKLKKTMEKITSNEDEIIESKLVTMSIGKAQKNIEKNNYDYREHLLKYDNVINEQRKIILNARKKVLFNGIDIFDDNILIEKIDLYIENKIKSILIKYQEYSNELEKELTNKFDFIEDELLETLQNNNIEEFENIIKEFLINNLRTKFNKFENIDNDEKNEIIKNIYLTNIDKQWQTYMSLISLLKNGIGLRGYNQKDPLIEFQKETFKEFEMLRFQINNSFIEGLINFDLEEYLTYQQFEKMENNFDLEEYNDLELNDISKLIDDDLNNFLQSDNSIDDLEDDLDNFLNNK